MKREKKKKGQFNTCRVSLASVSLCGGKVVVVGMFNTKLLPRYFHLHSLSLCAYIMLFKAAWNRNTNTPYIHTTHTNTNTHLLKAFILTYQEKGLGCCKPSKLREREREMRKTLLIIHYIASQVSFCCSAIKKKEFRALHYKAFISTNVFHFISFFNFFNFFLIC